MEYLFVDALDELIRAERYDISILVNRKIYSEAELPILTLYTALYNHEAVIEMLFRNGYPNIHDTTDIPSDAVKSGVGISRDTSPSLKAAEPRICVEEVELESDEGSETTCCANPYGTPYQVSKYPHRLQVALSNYFTLQDYEEKHPNAHFIFEYGAHMCPPICEYEGQDRRSATKASNRDAKWATPAILYGYLPRQLSIVMNTPFAIAKTNKILDHVHGLLRLRRKPIDQKEKLWFLVFGWIYVNVLVEFRLESPTGPRRVLPATTLVWPGHRSGDLSDPVEEQLDLEDWFGHEFWKRIDRFPIRTNDDSPWFPAWT